MIDLAHQISYNLEHQHDWASLRVVTQDPSATQAFPRPLICGTPPRPLYIHPDLQVEILKAEHAGGVSLPLAAEPEWVLPTHISESWSLKAFAEIFDAIGTLPPVETEEATGAEVRPIHQVGQQWRGANRQKRLLLATLQDDSTIVYYVMHDGIVKPRQN